MPLKTLVDNYSSSLNRMKTTHISDHVWLRLLDNQSLVSPPELVLVDPQHIEAACLSIRPDDQLQLV